jgi:hypothetical protein
MEPAVQKLDLFGQHIPLSDGAAWKYYDEMRRGLDLILW